MKLDWISSVLVCVGIVCLPRGRALICAESSAIGEAHVLNVSLSTPESLCIQLNSSTEAEAIRLFVESVNASSRHPVLVTVRQTKGVVSWALPYVESGFSYSSVERTLCPLLNSDESGPSALLVDLSTTNPTPLSVSLTTNIISSFRLHLVNGTSLAVIGLQIKLNIILSLFRDYVNRMNSPISLQASPSGPSYLLYEYETPPTESRLRVKFKSSDNSSDICAIASIQTAYCPVVELLDNPDHRGRYQTMRSIASINTRINSTVPHFGFFYVVLTVFPNDGRDNSCVFTEQGLGDELITLDSAANNFNPTPYSGPDRTKTVVIIVEPALSDSGYVIAIVVSTIVYVSFYIIALIWIVVFDWWRFDKHFMFKMIQRDPSQFAESAIINHELEAARSHEQSVDDNLSDELTFSEPVRPDSSDEEQDEQRPPTERIGVDEADVGPRNVFPRSRSGLHPSDLSNQSEKLVKRPSLISVLIGTHWNTAIDEASPHSLTSPHSHTPPYGRRRYISESHAHNPMYFHQPSNHTPQFKRHKSVSESQAVATPPPVSRSISMGRHHMVSQVTHSLTGTESHDQLRMRKTTSVDANGLYTTSNDQPDVGEDPFITVTNEEGETVGEDAIVRRVALRKQESYEAAIAEEPNEEDVSSGRGQSVDENREVVYSHDTCRFPVNLNLSEFGEFDDSSTAQKEYNHYSLYLLVIVVFYGIPAYQLVITYQRLLNVSGNEDVCYYNSLCAHPWDVYSGLSLSAFNNIFSNIGFFILGFLFILIAYRRRSIYRSFEKYNCPKPADGRVGVPQHFGIYYAIGLAMMAEAFMSVAYHICPSSTNYQFDTTFMYILAALGLHKLLESRSPDLEPGLHKIMLTLAFIIFVVVVGVLYSDSLIFWLLFFFVYLIFSFVFSVEVYYRWQLRPHWASFRDLGLMYKQEGLCPPKHIPKFVMAVVSIVVNWLFALGVVAIRPLDFGTFFLFILLSNFIMYLLYYTITKMVYREFPSPRPLAFVILALLFWIAAIFFYTRAVTDWSVSPALSRDNNVDCLVLGFYDSHDMWHFVSAFAIFFSFLILMTLDDKQEDKHRTTLRAF